MIAKRGVSSAPSRNTAWQAGHYLLIPFRPRPSGQGDHTLPLQSHYTMAKCASEVNVYDSTHNPLRPLTVPPNPRASSTVHEEELDSSVIFEASNSADTNFDGGDDSIRARMIDAPVHRKALRRRSNVVRPPSVAEDPPAAGVCSRALPSSGSGLCTARATHPVPPSA